MRPGPSPAGGADCVRDMALSRRVDITLPAFSTGCTGVLPGAPHCSRHQPGRRLVVSAPQQSHATHISAPQRPPGGAIPRSDGYPPRPRSPQRNRVTPRSMARWVESRWEEEVERSDWGRVDYVARAGDGPSALSNVCCAHIDQMPRDRRTPAPLAEVQAGWTSELAQSVDGRVLAQRVGDDDRAGAPRCCRPASLADQSRGTQRRPRLAQRRPIEEPCVDLGRRRNVLANSPMPDVNSMNSPVRFRRSSTRHCRQSNVCRFSFLGGSPAEPR